MLVKELLHEQTGAFHDSQSTIVRSTVNHKSQPKVSPTRTSQRELTSRSSSSTLARGRIPLGTGSNQYDARTDIRLRGFSPFPTRSKVVERTSSALGGLGGPGSMIAAVSKLETSLSVPQSLANAPMTPGSSRMSQTYCDPRVS